jgi:ATP adenylyltransferase
MSYIGRIEESRGCFLCEAAAVDELTAESLVLWKNDLALCIMNRFPYNNGHLMISPLRHTAELAELSCDERLAIFDGLVRTREAMAEVMTPDGFNVGLNIGRAAGAGVEDHMHFHIVPRWNGDTNFMPVFADVKVIPQALEDLWQRLKIAFDEREKA